MILKEKAPDVLVSGEFQETEFSMDDSNQHIIFEILRSKVYKNNIGAICREIASNSRDAQREIGDDITPIEIEIADKRQSFFYEDGLNIIFRDNGIGLSPERVTNIYTKYGASTKRDTNNQTGGFGLGAKTPFSYSDAFIVRTIVDGTEYVYSIYIDVSRKGKMALLYQEDTHHFGNLTEIIIPIKHQDLNRFQNEVLKNTYFWKVRPKLINFQLNYPNLDKLESPIRDIVLSVPNDYTITRRISFVESGINAIIDGIYYPIDMNIVDFDFKNYMFAICLFYDNGDLNISANRETLQYDDDTINNIKDRVNKILDSFREKYERIIKESKNVYCAQYTLNVLKNEDHFFGFVCQNINSFEYTDLITKEKYIIQYGNKWKPKACKIYYMSKYADKVEKIVVENILNKNVYERVNNIYWINQTDNDIHKNRFSGLINRTLINKHPEGFIIIVENTSHVKTGIFDKLEFDKNLANDKQKINGEYKIITSNYWLVPPTKITPKKKEKKTHVLLKTFYSGNYYKSQKFNFENGYFNQNKQNIIKDIIYYYIDREVGLSKELIEALRELSHVIYCFDKNTHIVIASNSKKKHFLNYKTVQQFIIENEKPIFQLYERYKMNEQINRANNYKNISFNKQIDDELTEILNMEKMGFLSFNNLVKFIHQKIPTFTLKTKDYSKVFDEILKSYPLLDNIDYKHINDYVAVVNDLARCKKILGEI